jgi:DNA primase
MISPATKEQIRAASDIVDVIGSYIPLKRAGANFVALCPFHKEKTPSFNVNPQRQIFHCFGCNKGGDVFTFVREYENIDFMDALRRLAERARIPLEMDSPAGEPQSRHLKDQLLLIHEQITQRWQSALASDPAAQIARDYLAKRAVSADAVQLFRLGYAPDLWDDTVNWAKSKHFEPATVEQAGLILRKEASDHYYDRFRGRLIFPICDEQGRVIGFSGRVLSGDEKTAKYVNSPESPLFTKGRVMFGLDKSKRAILDAQCVVICEGQLDLIACFMAGLKNVVAPQGTALTADHVRILKRYVKEAVLCFDSDNAGKNATSRSLDTLLAIATTFNASKTAGDWRVEPHLPSGQIVRDNVGLAIRVAVLPEPHDPDSFIKEFGVLALQQLIKKAPGFYDYYLERLCATNDSATDAGRLAIIREMSGAIQKSQSPYTLGYEVLLDTYAQKTAMRLSVPPSSVINEFKKFFRSSRRGNEENPQEKVADVPRPSPQEAGLLRLLLENDSFVEWIAAHLDLEWLAHPLVREIVAARLRLEQTHSWPGVKAWLSETDNATWQNLITELLVDNRPMPNPEAQLKGSPTRGGVVKNLRDSFIDRQLAALNQRFESGKLDDAATLDVLQKKARLNQLKQQPLAAQDA